MSITSIFNLNNIMQTILDNVDYETTRSLFRVNTHFRRAIIRRNLDMLITYDVFTIIESMDNCIQPQTVKDLDAEFSVGLCLNIFEMYVYTRTGDIVFFAINRLIKSSLCTIEFFRERFPILQTKRFDTLCLNDDTFFFNHKELKKLNHLVELLPRKMFFYMVKYNGMLIEMGMEGRKTNIVHYFKINKDNGDSISLTYYPREERIKSRKRYRKMKRDYYNN